MHSDSQLELRLIDHAMQVQGWTFEQAAAHVAALPQRRKAYQTAGAAAGASDRLSAVGARPDGQNESLSGSARTGRVPVRPKLFGDGRPVPLDRNGKVRVWVYARALMRRTEPGKHYGAVTAKALDVLRALLWSFHNAHSGRCFPSYETIAERAGCARCTVYEAIRALERVGILSWVNRIKRIKEWVPGLFGKTSAWCWRVKRTSNAYVFNDPLTKSDFKTGTAAQAANERKIASNVPRPSALSRTSALDFDTPTQKNGLVESEAVSTEGFRTAQR